MITGMRGTHTAPLITAPLITVPLNTVPLTTENNDSPLVQ